MKKIIILGIVVFLIALLLKTPASLIAKQVESNTALTLQGASGSLWKGNATRAVFDGVDVGEVSWTVSPLGLLTGAAKGDFTIQGDELTANGSYTVSVSKTLTLDNAQFKTTGSFINQFQRYAKMSGDLRGSIDHLEMQQTDPLSLPVVSAVLNWEQGGLTSPIRLPEGSYQLKIEPEAEGKLIGVLTAHDAPVDIKGNVVLDSEWQYLTDLKLKTTPKGQSLQGMISMVGRPKPDGYIHIKEKGKLFK